METKLTEYAIFLFSTRSVNRLYVYRCIVPKLTCSYLSNIRFPTHLYINIILYIDTTIYLYLYCYCMVQSLCKKKTEYYFNYNNFASILMCSYEEEGLYSIDNYNYQTFHT